MGPVSFLPGLQVCRALPTGTLNQKHIARFIELMNQCKNGKDCNELPEEFTFETYTDLQKSWRNGYEKLTPISIWHLLHLLHLLPMPYCYVVSKTWGWSRSQDRGMHPRSMDPWSMELLWRDHNQSIPCTAHDMGCTVVVNLLWGSVSLLLR